MAKTSMYRTDFRPLERTINALNKVSRTIQDERRKTAAVGGLDFIIGDMANVMSDLDTSAFASFPDFTFNLDDGNRPFGFVRALENDFTGRNWHEGWWDVGAALDVPMAGLRKT